MHHKVHVLIETSVAFHTAGSSQSHLPYLHESSSPSNLMHAQVLDPPPLSLSLYIYIYI